MRLIDAKVVEWKVEQFLQYRYEDYGMMFGPGLEILNIIRNAPTIEPKPNDPLTLDELREMDGEPVWMSTRRLSEWCIVHSFHSDDVIGGGIIVTRRTAEKRTCSYADYGKTWLAYRRRPEEGGSVGH